MAKNEVSARISISSFLGREIIKISEFKGCWFGVAWAQCYLFGLKINNTFVLQHRKQNFIRKSGGIGLFYKDKFKQHITLIDTETLIKFFLLAKRTFF